MKAVYLLAIVIAFLTGCASTKITGYSDPQYSGSKYSSVVVFASNVGLEQASTLEVGICEGFKTNGIKCMPFQMMFPPTRQHSADSVYRTMAEKGYASMLILTAGGDYSSSDVFGYQTYGSATAYGNQAYGQSNTYALRSYSRQNNMRLTLLDGRSGNTAWLGDAKTEGQGMVNVTDSAFNNSIKEKVVSVLMSTSHF